MRRSLLLLALFLTGCASVPVSGRRSLILMSEAEEKQLGEKAYRQLLEKEKLSKNEGEVARLRAIGKRLAAVSERPDFKWEFNLIANDESINAFCLPGGKVAFFTGILPVTEDDTGDQSGIVVLVQICIKGIAFQERYLVL